MRPLNRSVLALAVSVAVVGCGGESSDTPPPDDPQGTESNIIEVTARDFEYDMPEAIPSGWNTFRLVNESDEQEHFILLGRIPDDRTFAEYRSEVFNTFMDVFDRYSSAELTREKASQALADELPAWFFEEVEFTGGVGLTEAGRTSQATIHLEPGTYGVECYVKTPQGTFHNYRGMFRRLVVTEDSTGAAPPEADAELTLSNYEIETSGELTSGTQTVGVHVTERPDGLMTHDINLFRLEGDTTTVGEIVAWMDWMDLDEFRAPGPGLSLGGVEHLPAGATGYMTVDLEPGRYAWVSEAYGDQGMVKEFTVE